MPIQTRNLQPADRMRWDRYVTGHRAATPYHLCGWQTVIEAAYGHRTHFLLAEQHQRVVGILPLVHMRHPLSGNRLISMPFLDMAGVLADSQEIAGALMHAAEQVMQRVGASALELRQGDDCALLPTGAAAAGGTGGKRLRMLRDLPDDADTLLQSFRAKLRNQIRKPLALGLEVRSGGLEYFDDFYRVFVVNMRDLGSPVHSRRFLRTVLERFSGQTRVFVVYRAARPLAAGLVCLFQSTVYNPWAASLRSDRDSCPNMLLYWAMLAHACEHRYTRFDFGRSVAGEGTYRFKQQWGASPQPLHWVMVPNPDDPRPKTPATADQSGFQMAARLWSRLPVPVSRMIGPAIRKHIGL